MKTDTSRRKKRALEYRIKRGKKITGDDAVAAAAFDLGEIFRSADGSLSLRPRGRRTPTWAERWA
jgi:hypothetical protein